MNPKTARTFVWAAVISIFLGMVVMSPAGSFFLYSVTAIFALIPAIFGAKRTRIAAIVILTLSFALLVMVYPKFDAEMTKYRERAHNSRGER